MKNLLKIAHYILYFTIFTQPHSACETLDDFYYEPISFPLTGKQKKASLAIGIAELTRRIKIGDEAAIKCKAMPSATMEQQESTLNAYNAELQTLQARLQQGKKIALERGLDQNFKGTPSKAIRIASEQAAAEEERKLQEKIDELERAKKEAEEKAAQLTPLKAQLTTALARERATPHREKAAALQDELETVQKRLEQVEQLRKEAEERISDQLQADAQNMGSVVIGQLQELDSTEKTNQGVTIRKHRRTGRLIEDSSALDLLYESYTKMIADIKEQIDEHHTVCTDVESLNAVFKDALVHVEERQEKRGKQLFNVRFISYENLDKVFDVIDSALLIAQNYMSLQIPDGALDGKSSEEIENFVAEYKAKQAAKLKRDIQNARDDKRPGLVEDIFLNQFLDPASAEMMRLKKSDPLDLCLQCTRSFQEKVKIDEDRGFTRQKHLLRLRENYPNVRDLF